MKQKHPLGVTLTINMLQMNNTQKLKINKKINLDFSWWEITWNAWLLSISEFCNKLSVQELIKKHLPENKKWNIEHTKPEIIYQELIRIINWDTSNNNYIYNKKDPTFLEIHNWKIASASTCSRLDNTFNYSDESNLRKIQREIEKYNIKHSKTKEIIVDLDSTNDPCSQNLEWERWRSIFLELEYQANDWSHQRRVVCCIDWKPRETEESKKARKKNPKKKKVKQMWLFPIYSFVVTNNMKLSSEEVFSMYNWRATIEKSIEEAKNGFDSDHLSNSNFKVNATKFQIHLLAIQLTQLFRKFTLAKESKQAKREKNKKHVDSKNKNKKFKKLKVWRKEVNLPSISTLRKQIFSIPAKVVRSWRRIFYRCASSFPYQEKFMKVLNIIQKLPRLMVE